MCYCFHSNSALILIKLWPDLFDLLEVQFISTECALKIQGQVQGHPQCTEQLLCTAEKSCGTDEITSKYY